MIIKIFLNLIYLLKLLGYFFSPLGSLAVLFLSPTEKTGTTTFRVNKLAAIIIYAIVALIIYFFKLKLNLIYIPTLIFPLLIFFVELEMNVVGILFLPLLFPFIIYQISLILMNIFNFLSYGLIKLYKIINNKISNKKLL